MQPWYDDSLTIRERDTKLAEARAVMIPILEEFLSVPTDKWKTEHSRKWKSVFSSPSDADWAKPIPAPRRGMNEDQRTMLELILVGWRDHQHVTVPTWEQDRLRERAIRVGLAKTITKPIWCVEHEELIELEDRILTAEESQTAARLS
jgi:hypothetical protein